MRRKHNLASRIEKCSDYLVENPNAFRGLWLDGYDYGELHIELGCGKGLFTTETAKASPEILLVALEKTANVLVSALERAAMERLRNVRFLNVLVENLADCFAPGEVSRIYINFCDPWPSNRHAKRRLTAQGFLEVYRQILRPDGEIHFKTDNGSLFDFSLREFESTGFTLSEETRDLHKNGPAGVMTDYESRFYEQGFPIYHSKHIMSIAGK